LEDGSALLTSSEFAEADTLVAGYDTLRLEGSGAPNEIAPAVSASVSYERLKITSDLHRYSLGLSLCLSRPPAKEGFLLKLGWPEFIRIARQQELRETRRYKNAERLEYIEFTFESKETFWPGQTFEVVGANAKAELEYEFDSVIWHEVDGNNFNLNWAVFFLDSMPVEGKVNFDDLNCF
jgi:hypothetical protein